jgi:hypothetical protein
MKLFQTMFQTSLVALALAGSAQAQSLSPFNNQPTTGSGNSATGSWQKLKNQPTFQTDTALLLTDATVMVHEYETPNWWRLTPTSAGSYVNGTWSQVASMSSDYCPLYFDSAVLPDGRLLVEGGEYNPCASDETPLGAIYDPIANTWTNVNPPDGWSNIGDSTAVVLPNGQFMLGQNASTLQAVFNASNLTWTSVGFGKADHFAEEGFALLPNGKILTVDTEDGTNSEIYNPSTEQWSFAGDVKTVLGDNGGLPIVDEIGPMIQRPNGTVVAFGATSHNSVYNEKTGTWTPGPDFPNGDAIADGPASILTNGNVLAFTSPFFASPGTFYEFDGSKFNLAPGTASSPTQPSFQGRLLSLPTGQVLYTVSDGATIDVEVYTPKGEVNDSWRPVITSVPGSVTRGNSYKISGTQFNGLSVGATYGDDEQVATNYPIVVILTVNGFFAARTHDHSSMGIATGSKIVSTTFDVPASIPRGPALISVVANGIASYPRLINVK